MTMANDQVNNQKKGKKKFWHPGAASAKSCLDVILALMSNEVSGVPVDMYIQSPTNEARVLAPVSHIVVKTQISILIGTYYAALGLRPLNSSHETAIFNDLKSVLATHTDGRRLFDVCLLLLTCHVVLLPQLDSMKWQNGKVELFVRDTNSACSVLLHAAKISLAWANETSTPLNLMMKTLCSRKIQEAAADSSVDSFSKTFMEGIK